MHAEIEDEEAVCRGGPQSAGPPQLEWTRGSASQAFAPVQNVASRESQLAPPSRACAELAPRTSLDVPAS